MHFLDEFTGFLPISGYYHFFFESETLFNHQFFQKVLLTPGHSPYITENQVLNAVFFKPKGSTTFHVYVNTLSLRFPRVLYDHWNGTRFLFNKDLFPDKLKNFNGLVLRATSFNFPPYTYQARPHMTFQLSPKRFWKFFPKIFQTWILDLCIRKRTEAGVAGNFSSWKLSHQTSTLLWTFSIHLMGNFGASLGTDLSVVSSYHAMISLSTHIHDLNP